MNVHDAELESPDDREARIRGLLAVMDVVQNDGPRRFGKGREALPVEALVGGQWMPVSLVVERVDALAAPVEVLGYSMRLGRNGTSRVLDFTAETTPPWRVVQSFGEHVPRGVP